MLVLRAFLYFFVSRVAGAVAIATMVGVATNSEMLAAMTLGPLLFVAVWYGGAQMYKEIINVYR